MFHLGSAIDCVGSGVGDHAEIMRGSALATLLLLALLGTRGLGSDDETHRDADQQNAGDV